MKKILIIGGGGHARCLLDTLRSRSDFDVVGYTNREKSDNLDLPYLGTDDTLVAHFRNGVTCAVIGVGFMGGEAALRQRLFENAKAIGFTFPPIIDPSAIISSSATIGEGTYVGKRTVICTGVVVEKECIISSGAIVEHDSYVGEGTHISVSAALCGATRVGCECLIGANATLIQGVSTGDRVIVGAGSVVLHDVPCDTTVVGVPAKVMK